MPLVMVINVTYSFSITFFDFVFCALLELSLGTHGYTVLAKSIRIQKRNHCHKQTLRAFTFINKIIADLA